ncbi:MAG: hypothetical protein Q9M32_05705 [Sulfurimonas sp.]|nr:hypothetical protein [Sulfurimonas sp.]MDQ7062554.1 hypothetical protein [Sulfurimonas sp.]
MKRLILSTIAMGVLIGFSGCSNNPEDTLQESINNYKECMIDNDFKCQVEFMDITAMEEMTGAKVDIDAVVKEFKSSGIIVSNIQMNKPSKITRNGDILSSSISYSMTAKMQGQEIKTDASINAISKDNGSTWLFSSEY